jgi:type II secretory pathway pseudopilin PulG
MAVNLRTRQRAFRRNENGYVLITLILTVSLLIIAAAAIVPSIAFEIKRDREEEMIHRGVQYSRAIRTYYKKFGRYPARLEDLENTNNLRFLRKRYKDPITGQDFKLLHFGEVKMTFTTPLAGASNINGAAALNANPVFGQSQPGAAFGGQAGTFGNQAGSFGNQGAFGASATPGTAQNPSTPGDQNQPADPNSPSALSSSSSQSTGPQPGQQPGATPGDALSGQTFGGMPVVGVVSTSKKEGVREFNHKKKYSEWQFIYDPASDRGGLLMTPNQPPLQGFANQQLQPGQQGNTSNSPFGTSPGIQNNPSPMGPGGYGTQNPPVTNPPTTNPPNQQ